MFLAGPPDPASSPHPIPNPLSWKREPSIQCIDWIGCPRLYLLSLSGVMGLSHRSWRGRHERRSHFYLLTASLVWVGFIAGEPRHCRRSLALGGAHGLDLSKSRVRQAALPSRWPCVRTQPRRPGPLAPPCLAPPNAAPESLHPVTPTALSRGRSCASRL